MGDSVAFDRLMKILVMGDSGVGKTALLQRYVHNSFSESQLSTIGVEWLSQMHNIGNKQVKVQALDTSGKDRFRTVIHSFFQIADCFAIVFDTSKRDSFENVAQWVSLINGSKYASRPRVLIGNKVDQRTADGDDADEMISSSEGKRCAQELGFCDYYETSAKLGTQSEAMEIFGRIADSFFAEDRSIQQQQQTSAVQRSDSEGQSRQHRQPVWVPDSDASHCQLGVECLSTSSGTLRGMEFTFFNRKHHCRACGKVVCDRCSRDRIPTMTTQTAHHRACHVCLSAMSKHGVNPSEVLENQKLDSPPAKSWAPITVFCAPDSDSSFPPPPPPPSQND